MSQHTALRARPTKYRGIQMRSRLEARFAAWLDTYHKDWPWIYEPHAYASEAGQYLPDFVIDFGWHTGIPVPSLRLDEPGRLLVIDTKPQPPSGALHTKFYGPTLERMKIVHASEPEAICAIAYPWYTDKAGIEHWTFYAEDDFDWLLETLQTLLYELDGTYRCSCPNCDEVYHSRGRQPGAFGLLTD